MPSPFPGMDRYLEQDESGYRFHLYRREPDPALAGADAAWARSLITPKPETPWEADHGQAP